MPMLVVTLGVLLVMPERDGRAVLEIAYGYSSGGAPSVHEHLTQNKAGQMG